MQKKTTLINEAFTRMADAIAAVVSHPDCPVRIANDLVDLATDWENDYSENVTRAEDARHIRNRLPKLLNQAVAEERE